MTLYTAALLQRFRCHLSGLSQPEVHIASIFNAAFYTHSISPRYSVTVKKSDLTKSSSPAQRKRLLSLAAAESEPVRAWRFEGGEENEDSDDSAYCRRQLDSETGQALENGMDNNVANMYCISLLYRYWQCIEGSYRQLSP